MSHIQKKNLANSEIEKCSNKSLDAKGVLDDRNAKLESFKNNKVNSQYDNLCGHHSSVINLNGTGYDVALCESNSIHTCEYNMTNSNTKKSSAKAKLELKNSLINSRMIAADWSLAFGLIGFILMIIESECTMNGVYSKV